MEKIFVEKTKTVYKTWDPYEDCYGYDVDENTPAFKASIEKLQNYLKSDSIFKCYGLNSKIIKTAKYAYEEYFDVYELKRIDNGFIMTSSRKLEDIAKYLWIINTVGMTHIIK